ncbi:putative small secreted protein [Corynebacterium aquatimens]|uniref:Small secreted protein n=1 Tax=Corynebacterium aquatimens TaxID=1190508 RepID=A0A931GXB7_9CORY|nr:putative small secreted protein [Corynebacterium aquatimens]
MGKDGLIIPHQHPNPNYASLGTLKLLTLVVRAQNTTWGFGADPSKTCQQIQDLSEFFSNATS